MIKVVIFDKAGQPVQTISGATLPIPSKGDQVILENGTQLTVSSVNFAYKSNLTLVALNCS